MSHAIDNDLPRIPLLKRGAETADPPREGRQTLPEDRQGMPPGTSLKEETRKVVEAFTQVIRRELKFSVDEESGRTVIKVIDRETQEVIRQIPPEEVLAIARHLAEGDSPPPLLRTRV